MPHGASLPPHAQYVGDFRDLCHLYFNLYLQFVMLNVILFIWMFIYQSTAALFLSVVRKCAHVVLNCDEEISKTNFFFTEEQTKVSIPS